MASLSSGSPIYRTLRAQPQSGAFTTTTAHAFINSRFAWVNIIANRYSGGLLQWDMWAGIDRNRLPQPLNTLPFDHKSGSPESLLGLLPDINKPPIEGGSGQPCRTWIASSPRPGQRSSPPVSQNNLSSPPDS
jgi:hypothetical protein